MTKFEKWVRDHGVNRLARELRQLGSQYEVTPSAIYQWLYGDTEPRTKKMQGIVRISRGALSLDDILRHVESARARRTKREQQEAQPQEITK